MFRIKKVPDLIPIAFISFWIIYFGIVWLNAVTVRSDGWYAAYLPHWGDGAAHLSYMATFANRLHFPMSHPLFVGHPFTYSFAADMLGGLLSRAGLPLWFAYNILGFILSVATLCFLWRLIAVITRSQHQTWLSLLLFFTSGGLGFKYLVLDRLHPESVPDSPFFPLLFTQRGDTDIAWLNTIVGELIPQRALILALPIGAFILTVWYRRFILHQSVQLRILIFTGLLFGLMPVIHPHTTMVLALTIVVWGIVALSRQWRQVVRDLLIIGLPTVILGGYLTLTFLSPSVSSGFFKWYPGWLAASKEVNWFVFWLDNWGLFLPLAIVGTFWKSTQRYKLLLLPFWLWFILANLFLFQPYDWDNSKILTWVYLIFTIPVSALLIKLWHKNIIAKSVAVICLIILTLSGGIDAAHMLDTQTYALQLVNQDELKLAQYVRQYTSPESVILTATTHRNWVPLLTGRQILCGYQGWMWTYGINAGQRVEDIRVMYAGSDLTPGLLSEYKIDYVVIGPEERNEFHPNEAYFARRYKVLTMLNDTTIYKIN